jgi:DNA processing protein
MGLLAAHDGGDLGLARLVRDRGAVEVWDHVRAGGSTQLARRASVVDVDEVRRQTSACGARFIIPGDDEWPGGVDELAWSDPVGHSGGEPLGLWVIGPARLSDLTGSVAMVGSRASTAYGEHVAADWAAGLAEHGRVVVSGGAYGIDAAAHRGVLGSGGVTVAVMAGGLARLYPVGNSALLDQIAKQGAVVSEYPPERSPSRARFLVRNRLIAALSQATVIVEAALRSGAQNTVSWALSLQRPVLAAPGPVTSSTSYTPHRLIRESQAIAATTVEDILEVVEPLGVSRMINPGASDPSQPLLGGVCVSETGLTPAQARVRAILPSRRGISVDELSARTGESPLALLVSLAQLKQLGQAVQTRFGTWRVAHP